MSVMVDRAVSGSEPRRQAALRLVATALAAAVAGTLLFRSYESRSDANPLRGLIAASRQAKHRAIEPRLTGFQWAPLKAATRGEREDRAEPLIVMAAADVVGRTSGNDRLGATHAVALADLVSGKAQRAADALSPVAVTSGDATVWSDLAAARYVVATLGEDPTPLSGALAAADAALRLDPLHPEAQFNCALILERFGLRDQAREAWERYLLFDAESEWADEARQHVRRLQPVEPFKETLNRNYERLAASVTAAREFARQYPEDSRRWGETEILGRWAAAYKDGDHALAARHLGVAREFGAELARNKGDRMLLALVAAIDSADGEKRGRLAEAHLAFRAGQQTYRTGEPGKAERMLVAAAESFSRGESPGTLLAQYFAANTAYSQGRLVEAEQKIEQLVASAPSAFHAHRAQLLWQLGVNHFAAARWGAAIDALIESVATFTRIDEPMGAANVRQILATAYERIGNPEESWRHRMITLRELGKQPSARLETMLRQFGRMEAANGDWAAATSFFDRAYDIGRRLKDSAVQVETLTHRAMANVRRNDHAAARADVAEARAELTRVREPAYQRLLGTNLKEVEAILSDSPATAIALLSDAIEFHRTEGRRMYLPELYLERGRAYLKLQDRRLAAFDFESGVAELESRRETLAKSEERWGIFYDADELFAAAIDLAAANGDVATAFDYAERARARGLLDALGATHARFSPASLPEETVLVETFLEANRLLIFVASTKGVRLAIQPIGRDALIAEANRFLRSVHEQKVSELRQAGRALYQHLVAPVENELADIRAVVFVSDPRLGALPYAALTDAAGLYLIERYAVSVAPSAVVFARLPNDRIADANARLLMVTGGTDTVALSALQREATAVSRLYRNVARLSGESATPQSVLRAAPQADIIHFAGHAAMTSASRPGHLHVGGSGSSAADDLDLKQIAALKLRRTSLVVLAACDTAAGEVRATEGSISIARAFLAAGVPSVIATLLPIDDDDAASLFPRIHRYVARGLSPAEALRAAQIDAIGRGDRTAVWAAVQLLGR